MPVKEGEVRAEELADAIRRGGWDVCVTESGAYRVCTYPAQHPLALLVDGPAVRTGFCDGVFAESGAVRSGLMSAADARIARFACGVGHFDAHPARWEHALLVAGAERHEFDRIRATQAGLHALAHRVKS